MRRRVRLDYLLVAVVVLAIAGAVALGTGATTSSSGGGPVPSARPVATRFAGAYLLYLDGRLTGSGLPDTTAAIRRDPGVPIAPGSRAGKLVLTRVVLTDIAGASAAQAAFIGRDDRGHRVSVQIGLEYGSGAWEVVALTAPDLVTDLAVPVRARSAPPAARAMAARFAQAYGDYAAGVTRTLPPSSATVLGQIRSGKDPLAGAMAAGARPHVDGIYLGPPGNGTVDAIAKLSAAGGTQTFAFLLSGAGGRWHVSYLVPNSGGITP